MRTAKEYRMTAKETLAGNYGTVIGVYIIYTMIVSALSVPSSILSSGMNFLSGLDPLILPVLYAALSLPISFIASMVTVILSTGLSKVTFDIVRGKRGDVVTLFYGFQHNVMTVICAYLWIILYILPAVGIMVIGGGISIVMLVMMDGTPAVIGGVVLLVITCIAYFAWIIVVSYAVSMTYYIYYDNPDMRARDLVRRSMSLMKGHKMQLFRLYLSYLGYYLLGFLSCGLALLWITPNVTAATVLFYDDLISADDPDAKVRPFEPAGDGHDEGPDYDGTGENENSPGNGEIPYSQESETTYHQNYWN